MWLANESPIAPQALSGSGNSDHIKELEERERQKEYLKPRRTIVDLFWIEKLGILLDYFQCYGIIWQSAQPWPWPSMWIIWTRWMMFANIDVYSLADGGALAGQTGNIIMKKWGSRSGYLGYASAFAVWHFLLSALIIIFFVFKPLEKVYGKRLDLWHSPCMMAMILISKFLYLPSTLAVARLYYCEPDDNTLSADPQVLCSSSAYIGAVFFCTVMQAVTVISLPIIMFTFIKESLVYENPIDHEKRLIAWEISYSFKFDDDWVNMQLWLTSSFRLHSCYFHVYMIIFKLVLLLIFIFARSNFCLQGFLLWLFITIFYVACIGFFNLPYRCSTSNGILATLWTLLFINAYFGLTNSCGAKNPITIASTESIFLLLLNLLGLVVILAILAMIMITNFRAHKRAPNPMGQWPSMKVLAAIVYSPDEMMLPKACQWFSTLQEALFVRDDFLRVPLEVADISGLEKSIRALHQCWLSARSCGSICEILINETLEDMIIIHSKFSRQSTRRFEYWNNTYLELMKEGVFAKRRDVLITGRKRRILNKLLALKAFHDRERLSRLKNVMELRQKKHLDNLKGGGGGGGGGGADGFDLESYNEDYGHGDEEEGRGRAKEYEEEELQEMLHQEQAESLILQEVASLEARTTLFLREIDKDIHDRVMEGGGEEDSIYNYEYGSNLLKSWNRIIEIYVNEGMEFMSNQVIPDSEVESWYTNRAAVAAVLKQKF